MDKLSGSLPSQDIAAKARQKILDSIRLCERLKLIVGAEKIFDGLPVGSVAMPYICLGKSEALIGDRIDIHLIGLTNSKASADLIGAGILQAMDDCPLLIEDGVIGYVYSGISQSEEMNDGRGWRCLARYRMSLTREKVSATEVEA